jgi:hypothetical protein
MPHGSGSARRVSGLDSDPEAEIRAAFPPNSRQRREPLLGGKRISWYARSTSNSGDPRAGTVAG